MTFIKWFTGNDLFTPCLSISYSLNKYAVLLSCKGMEVLYMRDVMKQGGHQRKQFCSLHASLQSKPYLFCTLFLFPQLQGLVWCQGPEWIPSALGVWVLGLRGHERKAGSHEEISSREICGGTLMRADPWLEISCPAGHVTGIGSRWRGGQGMDLVFLIAAEN